MGKVVSAGDVYLCDFSQSTTGSMQSGLRPCIIVDNKMACAFSPCIHCVPLTTQTKKYMPLHYILDTKECSFLDKDSIALCEQYTLVDKLQLKDYIGRITQLDLINISERCKKNLPFVY